MTPQDNKPADAAVVQFILDQIESVPHLEALLLLRNSRPQKWSVETLGKRLYINPEAVRVILDDLIRRDLVAADSSGPSYFYESRSPERDEIIAHVDETYRRQVVRISQLIHSKPSAAVRDFARAFRFTKDQ
jgi:predicted ArsR family transcriptional regulator